MNTINIMELMNNMVFNSKGIDRIMNYKKNRNWFLIYPFIVIFAVGALLAIRIYMHSSDYNMYKSLSNDFKSNTEKKRTETNDLSVDKMENVLNEQGITGKNINKLKNDMTNKIKRNLFFAYSVKNTNALNKISTDDFSHNFIDNLISNDKSYKYEKSNLLLRKKATNVDVKYSDYDYKTGNVIALVNVKYQRLKFFDTNWDGDKNPVANDTYTLKCNLNSLFADMLSYEPAITINSNSRGE